MRPLGQTGAVFALLLLLSGQALAQLDTKKIFAEHLQGVVKLLMYDPVLEERLVAKQGESARGSGFISRGSGFIVTADGLIFTNRHVIETCLKGYVVIDYKDEQGRKVEGSILTYEPGLERDPDIIDLYYSGYTIPIIQIYNSNDPDDYTMYVGEVLALSETFDGAIVKIKTDLDGNPVTRKFKPVPLGNSDTTPPGGDLAVFGFPAQYQGGASNAIRDMVTLTRGQHSGWDYVFNQDFGFIKTDSEIHSGNSGGPVFDETNRVIGIATAKGTTTGIGLVGGINAMWSVAKFDADLHRQVTAVGLQAPRRAGPMNVLATADKYTVPDPQNWRNGGSNNNTGNTGGYAMKRYGTSGSNNASSGFTITGKVVSADAGRPIGGATVGLLVQKNGEWVVVASAVSKSDGSYSMNPNIASGTYRYAAVCEGYSDLVADVTIAEGKTVWNVKMAKRR